MKRAMRIHSARLMIGIATLLGASATLRAQSGAGGSGGAGGGAGAGGIEQRQQQAQPPGTPADALITPDPLGFVFDPINSLRAKAKENIDLDVLGSYTAFDQYADRTMNSPHNQLGGRLDLSAAWALLHVGKDTGSLNILVRSSENVGNSQHFDLSDESGSILGTNSLQGGGPEIPVSVNLLYWKQTFFDQKLAIYLGKLHPNQHIDLSTVADDESRQFMAGSYTGNAANPRSGIWATGAAAELNLPDDFYVHGIIVDANGRTDAGPQTLHNAKFYEAVETGFKGTVPHVGDADYRLFGWHNQTYTAEGLGFGVGFDQEIGTSGWTPFGRFGYGNAKATTVDEFASLGIANIKPFGRADDMFGVAGSWSRPSDRTLRQESLFEMFYRLRLTNSLDVSPDLQYIIHPANQAGADHVFLAALRVRVIF